MKPYYTEAAKERCFSLIDADIDIIWDDIRHTPEDTDAEKWKKKFIAIASEYVLSSRFALMRIFQSQHVSAKEIENDSSTGFKVNFSDGSTGEFVNISIEHAVQMEQAQLDLYEKLMMDRASRQTYANYQNDLRLIQKALQIHQKKTTLLTKDEAMSLGHMIGLTLNEMEWFLLRVFNAEGGFCYNSSDDLIDAYVFLRTENHKTGASSEQLKSEYHSKYDVIDKTPHDDNLHWTMDNGSSLSDNVRLWSTDNCDKQFKEWIGIRAEHLDLPSLTALRVYRNLAVFIYNLITAEEVGQLNYPDVDYAVHKGPNGRYYTDYVKTIRKARKTEDTSVLYDDGIVSEENCKKVAQKLLLRNQALSSVTPHPDRTKPWRDNYISDRGKLSPNGGINVVRTRVSDILFGKVDVQKNDLLYLIWFITCQCWGYGSDNPDVRTRLEEFIDVCVNTLNDAALPAFYPPHIMEQSMLLSIVYAYSCEQFEKAEPLIIYNDICEALIEKRTRRK